MKNRFQITAIAFLCAGTFFLPSFAKSSGNWNKTLNLCEEIGKAWNLNDTGLLAVKARELDRLDLNEKTLSGFSDADIEKLSDAFSHTSIYLKNRLKIMELLFIEKGKRKILNKGDISDAYYFYLEYRVFDKAKAIKEKFPKTTFYSLPKKISGDKSLDGAKWAVYDTSRWGNEEVLLKPLDLDKGPHIIMFFFPGCHASEKAMEDIMKDAEIAKTFKEHGVLLTFTFSPESVQLWKDHFKFSEIYIANKQENFPGFNGDISPNFYFLKDGQIVSHSNGWSKIDSKFTDQLNKIGVKTEKRPEEPETISPREKPGSDQAKNMMRIPKALEILKKLPEEDLTDFLKSMEINNGIIFYFDKALLARHYSGQELDKLCAFFIPSQKKLEKAEKKGEKPIKLGEVIKNIPGDAGIEFLKHLNIYDGAIMSASIGDLQKVLSDEEIEKILAKVL